MYSMLYHMPYIIWSMPYHNSGWNIMMVVDVWHLSGARPSVTIMIMIMFFLFFVIFFIIKFQISSNIMIPSSKVQHDGNSCPDPNFSQISRATIYQLHSDYVVFFESYHTANASRRLRTVSWRLWNNVHEPGCKKNPSFSLLMEDS